MLTTEKSSSIRHQHRGFAPSGGGIGTGNRTTLVGSLGRPRARRLALGLGFGLSFGLMFGLGLGVIGASAGTVRAAEVTAAATPSTAAPASASAPAPAAQDSAANKPAAELSIGAFMADTTAKNIVLAKIDGRQVYRSELVMILNSVMRTADPRLRDMPISRIYDKLMLEVVNGKILAQAARQEKLDQEPEVVAELKAYEEKLLQDRYLDSKLGKKEPTDEAIRAQYAQFLAQNPPKQEAHARHILVKTEKLAKQIIDKINKGGDFKKLEKQYSLDKNAKNGGDLGFFGQEEMVPEFSAATFALKPKTVTQTPVKTDYGYHIIYLEAFRQVPPPKLEEVREQLVNDYMQAAANQIIEALRSKSKIELFTMDGKPVEVQAAPQK